MNTASEKNWRILMMVRASSEYACNRPTSHNKDLDCIACSSCPFNGTRLSSSEVDFLRTLP
eukprot:4332163-Amphidinium_carterae.2